MTDHHSLLIAGGGNAGLAVAAMLRDAGKPVTIVEPSEQHYYQPIWTLVGGGVFDKQVSQRAEADYIPAGATWIRDAVSALDPENNQLTTRDGRVLTYDQLVVAAGLQLDWDAIPGLEQSVGRPDSGVCSNYSYETVESTWRCIRSFAGGTAIFTMPNTPIKCPGAPQKICYLAASYFARAGLSGRSKVIYASATPGIFGVPKYAATLNKVVTRLGIEPRYRHNLTALRPEAKEAVFQQLDGGQELVLRYDMIHVTPPQSAPRFLAGSPLANRSGWVEVDPATLQHVRHANVFALGDCSSAPTSKTGAAIRKQAPVLVANLLAHGAGCKALPARYDGYTACPLVTGYGSLVLAEFDYEKNPAESFPFDQAEERYSMYALKAYGLPRMYWHGILRGRC